MKISSPVVLKIKYDRDIAKRDNMIERLKEEKKELKNGRRIDLETYKEQHKKFRENKNKEIDEIKENFTKILEENENLIEQLRGKELIESDCELYLAQLEEEREKNIRLKVRVKELLEELETRTNDDEQLYTNKMNSTRSPRVKKECKNRIAKIRKKAVELAVQIS